jgi:hypothetical protein
MRARFPSFRQLGFPGTILAASVVTLGLLGGGLFLLLPARVDPDVIRISVIREVAVVDRAWQLPVASTFSRRLNWQSNGSLCGPASLANVYRSLGEPARTEADVLAGTGRCWIGFCIPGMTLDELAEVARAHTTRTVTVLRDFTPEDFRNHMLRANNPDRRYIINFSRHSIFGAGVGHHSPIGGYLESEDLVFVLNVNRDFQPWLIERTRLFSAMNTLDGEMKRGLLLIE